MVAVVGASGRVAVGASWKVVVEVGYSEWNSVADRDWIPLPMKVADQQRPANARHAGVSSKREQFEEDTEQTPTLQSILFRCI